jgi:heme oxygenase
VDGRLGARRRLGENGKVRNYVAVFSDIGGQVIRRRLEAHFGPSIGAALTFYCPYGADTAAQWQRFRQVVEQLATEAVDEAEAAAQATFAAIGTALAG